MSNNNVNYNLLKVSQGGVDLHGYWDKLRSYRFTVKYSEENIKKMGIFAEEIIKAFYNNHVVVARTSYRPKNSIANYAFEPINPEYIEDGLVGKLKKEVMENRTEDMVCSDYSKCITEHLKVSFTDKVRYDYFKYFITIKKELDWKLYNKMLNSTFEYKTELTDKSFPMHNIHLGFFNHPEIEKQGNDYETVKKYYESKEYDYYIFWGLNWAGFTVIFNRQLVDFQKLMEKAEPIAKELGLEFESKEDPYWEVDNDLPDEYWEEKKKEQREIRKRSALAVARYLFIDEPIARWKKFFGIK